MTRWHNHYADNCAHFCTATVQDWRSLLEDDAIAVLYGRWEHSSFGQLELGESTGTFVCDGWGGLWTQGLCC